MEVEAGVAVEDRLYCPEPTCYTLFMVPEGGTSGRASCDTCGFDFCYRSPLLPTGQMPWLQIMRFA